MQYTKQDVFNTLKEMILKYHPEILPEQITPKASFFQHLKFDMYDLTEIIIYMEQRFKLLNNNISYLRQFSYVNEFCENFYNILKEQSPELIADEPVSRFPFNGFGFMKRFIITPSKIK